MSSNSALIQFVDSHICRSGHFCVKCRQLNAGREVRANLASAFTLPDGAPDFACPKDLPWTEDVPPPQPIPKERWLPTWQQAGAWAAAKLSKVGVAAKLIPPVSPQVRALRQLSCHGNASVPPCPSRRYSIEKKFHYCGDCGCSDREEARLSSVGSEPSKVTLLPEDNDKYSHPYLLCPRHRPGFTLPRKKRQIIVRQEEGLGDATILTAVLRDAWLAYPDLEFEFRGWTAPLFANLPYVHTAINNYKKKRGHRSNAEEVLVEVLLRHMPGYKGHLQEEMTRQLEAATGLTIPITRLGGDLRLSPEEKEQASRLQFSGGRYYILNAGAKRDGHAMTVKQPDLRQLQKMVDYFYPTIRFVQIGSKFHFHPLLKGAIDFRETKEESTFRKALVALYYAEGVITPISWMMHAAPALELPPEKQGRERRGIILAGGREPKKLVYYPGQDFLDTFGELDCCKEGACWKERVEPNAGAYQCSNVVETDFGAPISKCQELLTADRVIRAIERRVSLPLLAG